MTRLGIATGLDLKNCTLPFLEQHFGKFGHYLYDAARAIDNRPVRPNRERKSVGAERTFSDDIATRQEAEAMLVPIIEKVAQACQRRVLSGRTVTLKVKYADFEQITRRTTLEQPIDSVEAITHYTHILLESLVPFPKRVRLLGVSLSTFGEEILADTVQLQLKL